MIHSEQRSTYWQIVGNKLCDRTLNNIEKCEPAKKFYNIDIFCSVIKKSSS